MISKIPTSYSAYARQGLNLQPDGTWRSEDGHSSLIIFGDTTPAVNQSVPVSSPSASNPKSKVIASVRIVNGRARFAAESPRGVVGGGNTGGMHNHDRCRKFQFRA